jgi:CRISPR-associated endonuclease/helicase Cas3
MNGKPLAHSSRQERGIPAQPFWEHIERVTSAATDNAARAARFWTGDRESFRSEVEAAARLHDCGKLAPENQAVLATSSTAGLPVRHEDAGTALLLRMNRDTAALLVASHHVGLPSMPLEDVKRLQKGPGKYRFAEAVEHTARHVDAYSARYAEVGCAVPPRALGDKPSALARRFALSCLVDADHSDTARHYREAVAEQPADPRWGERTQALDRYVATLPESTRSLDRREVYECCRDARLRAGIVACDAAVGSGKTTAVMAHLLRVADERRLRHIFVVLPYTNIIQQSVEAYRRAVVLPGEDPASVVAEVHHRAEFERPASREMSVLWDAPVTVTTAVQFFETLAANKPARLRKLHELPGSAVFIDEAHAAIPVWLWPQTWLWLQELANDWGCYFVLASGSLARFWENSQIIEPSSEKVPDLLTPEIRARLAQAELCRVRIRTHPVMLNCADLRHFVATRSGPRLVILNTIQSAAALADEMRNAGQDVLHLSTALAPADRGRIVQTVRARLQDPRDANWTLVATSCVEAGVDFSFRTAIRESCSAASVIQTGGRVNRHGLWADAEVWDVRLRDALFNDHPAFRPSRFVLAEMLEEGWSGANASDSVTEALRRELVLRDVRERASTLKKKEACQDFPEVANIYKVIESDTRTVVVDGELVRRLERGERVSWCEMVRGSVQMWARKVQDWRIRQVAGHEELYCWTGPYDSEFLGYMKGILPLIQGRDTGLYA